MKADYSVDISVVVPVYNSAQIIPELASRVEKAMKSVSLTYELILTDDCSIDNSWEVISELCHLNNQVIGLRLAKNSGQWCSTLAGVSRASGEFIVTIDDDLEYAPADILKLHQAISTSDYYIVFGMAKEKYLLQGKNPQVSKWRKSLVHALWNSPPTDSFKIFYRKLVFNGTQFLPSVFLDAYIVHKLDKRFMGYIDVGFNKRHAGESNAPLLKKINLFFLYGFHFALNPVKNISAFSLLFLSPLLVAVLFSANSTIRNLFLPALGLLILLTGLLNLYYLSQIFWKTKKLPMYVIVEELNRTH